MKPQQDKFVKDKLLKQIFQEIAEENAEIGEPPYQEEKSPDYSKTLSKKRNIQKIRQRVIIAMLLILIIFVLFNPNDETSDHEIHDSKKNMYNIPIANQIPTEAEKSEIEKENKEVLVKEKPLIKISEKKPMVNTKIIPEAPIESAKTLTVEEPKTAREKAKDILMQQMQN